MEADTLTTAAVGVGIIAAGVWNGWQTFRTQRLARETSTTVQELTVPVQEVHRQVSVNRHVSNPPTLLDKIDHVQRRLEEQGLELRGAATMFEGHMNASSDDRADLWRHVQALEQLIGLAPPPHHERNADDEPDLS